MASRGFLAIVLGVITDSDLKVNKFYKHISEKVNKTYTMLGIFPLDYIADVMASRSEVPKLL